MIPLIRGGICGAVVLAPSVNFNIGSAKQRASQPFANILAGRGRVSPELKQLLS
jgi:hypothetical protein